MIDPASECDHFADNALCIYFSLLCHGALCAGRVGTKDKLNEASLQDTGPGLDYHTQH